MEQFTWSARLARVRELPDIELHEMRLEMQTYVNELKESMQANSGVQPRFREYLGNRSWLTAAESRQRLVGLDMQRLQIELTRRKKLAHEQAQAQDAAKRRAKKVEADAVPLFERRFVDAAKLMLPARQFRDICRAASGVIEMAPHPDREPQFGIEVTP